MTEQVENEKTEIEEFIYSNYSVKGACRILHYLREGGITNMRMLSGYSAGGLFGLYALFHDPDLFSKYFIGSPSITSFQDSITFKHELDYSNSHIDLPADVFMSVGQLEEENSESMKKIADLIYSRNYKNLNLKTMVFENENHYTCYSVAITRGLIELLGK